MYNNLIYFLLVLLIFTTYQGAAEFKAQSLIDLGMNLVLLLVYWALCRQLFKRLLRRMLWDGVGYSLAYQRLTMRLSILALGFFAASVYFFGLKDLLLSWPLIGRSTALTGFFGLACFALYLAIMWGEAHGCFRLLHNSRLSRGRYIFSQLRFNLPITLPYLLISGAMDLAALLPETGFKAWLSSPTGEAVFLVAFLSFLVVFFPALIRPLWGLKPLPPSPDRSMIEDFCRRQGFYYRDVMLWPLYEGEGLTAGVMGLVRRWRYILVTRSLMRILNREELEAVLAHELGHVKKKHLLFYFLFFLGYLVLAYTVFDLNIYMWMFSDLALHLLTAAEAGPSTMLSLLVSLPVIILMILYFRFVLGVFMRNFERQADLYAYGLTGTIDGLVGSLEKIARYSGMSRDTPSWHHYSVAQRVDFLRRCQEDPRLAQGHERKIRTMLVVYVLALALVAWSGFQFRNSDFIRQANMDLALKAVQKEIERQPQNPQAYRYLGDIYTQVDKPRQAVAAYEKALELGADDPETLNNLAWTLITQEDPDQGEKDRALTLARRAVEKKPAAHILDTLAEALYVNDRPGEAVRVIDRALRRAGPLDDKAYLRKQKEKFQKTVR